MRNNATDQCTYDNITHDYEQQRKLTDAPYFGYTMTIQNHSSYDVPFDNFDDKRIVVENADAPDLGYYLSLIKYSGCDQDLPADRGASERTVSAPEIRG